MYLDVVVPLFIKTSFKINNGMAEIKIYYIPNIQHLVFADNPDLRLENMPMNRFDSLFYKSSTNTMDFSIRDRDRKPINLLDKTLSISISNVETGQLATVKTLEKLDLNRGYARLTLTATDLNEMSEGFYNYSVKITEDNGREGYAFVDQSYRVTGQFELRGNAVPSNNTSQTISTFLYRDGMIPAYYSGAIAVPTGTVHTAAWYLTAYTGTLELQVTTNQSAPTTDTDWATYETFDTNDLTPGALSCIRYMNTIGNYSFVRFKYTPDALNTGSMDQVIFN